MSANDWTIPTDGGQMMNQQQRRLMHQERRPQIKQASDVVGPGLASKAVQLLDWNAEEAAFNGIFWSLPTGLNAPDNTHYWIGTVLADADGFGVQKAQIYHDASDPTGLTPEWERKFYDPGTGVRNYGPWVSTEPPAPAQPTWGYMRATGTNQQMDPFNPNPDFVDFATGSANNVSIDVTNNEMTIMEDGYYEVVVQIATSSGTVGDDRFIQLMEGGSTILTQAYWHLGGSGGDVTGLVAVLPLTVGDVLSIYVYIGSGGTTFIQNATQPAYFHIQKVHD